MSESYMMMGKAETGRPVPSLLYSVESGDDEAAVDESRTSEMTDVRRQTIRTRSDSKLRHTLPDGDRLPVRDSSLVNRLAYDSHPLFSDHGSPAVIDIGRGDVV